MPRENSESFTIYHNPRCSKSRQTLKLLQDNGIDPNIIRYLETPPTVAELQKVVALLDVNAAELLRTGEAVFSEICGRANVSNAEAIQLMAEYPQLMQRPIVVTADRAVIGRPPKNVLKLL